MGFINETILRDVSIHFFYHYVYFIAIPFVNVFDFIWIYIQQNQFLSPIKSSFCAVCTHREKKSTKHLLSSQTLFYSIWYDCCRIQRRIQTQIVEWRSSIWRKPILCRVSSGIQIPVANIQKDTSNVKTFRRLFSIRRCLVICGIFIGFTFFFFFFSYERMKTMRAMIHLQERYKKKKFAKMLHEQLYAQETNHELTYHSLFCMVWYIANFLFPVMLL